MSNLFTQQQQSFYSNNQISFFGPRTDNIEAEIRLQEVPKKPLLDV
jgi:hypothetical protein